MAPFILLFLLGGLAVQGALSCHGGSFCPMSQRASSLALDRPRFINISLEGHANLSCGFDYPSSVCRFEYRWKILRADGETELYFSSESYFSRNQPVDMHPESGLEISEQCYIVEPAYLPYINYCCNKYLYISPTDLRYNGSQISAEVFNISECRYTDVSNFSSPVTTLGVQGYLDPPTEVQVELVSVDTVNVSWSPPFTLKGVPILHYTVYIISSTGYSEAVYTTQTDVSLQRPCSDTTYQVSGWNEVGEGNTSSPVTYRVAPPTNVTVISSSTEVQISWTAPADWEYCITHYSIYITDSSGAVSVTNTTDGSTRYTIDEPCNDVTIEVSGWSEEGERERSSPKEVYAHFTLSEAVVKTFPNLTDSVICAYCSFTTDSKAEGCAVELESEVHTYLFNMSRSTSGGGELSESVLDCFTVEEAGHYSVHVYEIQCNGQLGHRNTELPDVSVASNKQEKNVTDSVVTALAVMFGLTVVVLVVVVFVCATAILCMKWKMKYLKKRSSKSAGSTYERINLKAKYIELSSNAT